jgi:phospholipase C
MENRSFDHVLGALRLREGRAVDGLSGDEENPDLDGEPVRAYALGGNTVSNPPHDWEAVHRQWNGGANDGFVIAHGGPERREVMGHLSREVLPVTYALADHAAICDRWFASTLGPTWPNRLYLHGATARGRKENAPVIGFTSIFDRLDDAGLSSRVYFGDVPWCAGGYFKLRGLDTLDRFFADAAAGELPRLAMIDPAFFGADASDDHPHHDLRLGQALIGSVVAALGASPQWSRCLLVLVYDEHGGFFDHVPPPPAIDDDPEFRRLGFRVPALVMGPHVRRGAVSTVFDHVSVLRTVALRFGLPSLDARMEAATDLSACIDPEALAAPRPAPVLPPAPFALARLGTARPTRVAHPELWEMVESGAIPAELDRRDDAAEIAARWLRHGETLGAVRL